MIYETLKIAPAGDRHLLAVLGNDASLEVNFLSLSLAASIDEAKLNGVTDLIPSYNSVLVQYDFDRISYGDLCAELTRLRGSLPPVDKMEIRSRVVRIPVYYGDPWTKACIDEYRAKIAQRDYDPDFVARINGLAKADDVYAKHSGCEQWVVTVSSFPGLPILRALDLECQLVSPKYNPPRTWTPVGAIGVGGTSTSIYTIPSPGGYNLIGRTPVAVWDPAQKHPAFKDNAILLRAADRVRFVPIGRDEYDAISASFREGRYEYSIECDTFSVSRYRGRNGHVAPARKSNP